MRFFLEETSFFFPAGVSAVELEGHIEQLVELVRTRHDREETVFRWSGLEGTTIQPGIFLADLLYGSAFQLDHDTQIALQQAVNRCVHWDDVVSPAPAPNVEIDGVPCQAPTVAVVHERISGGEGATCLTLGVRPDRAKVCVVEAGGISHSVHFVATSAQLPSFYRTLFELENMEPDGYLENACDAFPEIGFVPKLAAQFSRFETKYRDLRPIVTAHLSALNDHFRTLFTKHSGKPFETIREFGTTCGVDASSESPKTRQNKAAMKERDVVVDGVQVGHRWIDVGKTVRCEWHTKIAPTFDRIHFHPGKSGVAESRLIVGIFAKHLTV